jgi:hypothetical protein
MKKEKEQIKRPYEKPAIRPIELTTEEVMGVCKANGGGGPRGACNFCSSAFGHS